MKGKFLLYVSSIICLSLSTIQISTAMQSDSDGQKKVVLYPNIRNDKVSVSFNDPRSNRNEEIFVLVKFKIQNSRNGIMQYCLIRDALSKKNSILIFLTEDHYNQTNALLADASVERNG